MEKVKNLEKANNWRIWLFWLFIFYNITFCVIHYDFQQSLQHYTAVQMKTCQNSWPSSHNLVNHSACVTWGLYQSSKAYSRIFIWQSCILFKNLYLQSNILVGSNNSWHGFILAAKQDFQKGSRLPKGTSNQFMSRLKVLLK